MALTEEQVSDLARKAFALVVHELTGNSFLDADGVKFSPGKSLHECTYHSYLEFFRGTVVIYGPDAVVSLSAATGLLPGALESADVYSSKNVSNVLESYDQRECNLREVNLFIQEEEERREREDGMFSEDPFSNFGWNLY